MVMKKILTVLALISSISLWAQDDEFPSVNPTAVYVTFDGEEVTELMIRWHKFIKNFYDPSLEVLRCLGLMYVYDPEFSGKFQQIDPDLPDFLGKAINSYVDVLEEKWLEQQCNVLEQ